MTGPEERDRSLLDQHKEEIMLIPMYTAFLGKLLQVSVAHLLRK